MRGNQSERSIEERVTILTESERIEGTVYYLTGSRLSDFLNSPIQQEAKFLRVKDPEISCRLTKQELGKAPFAMVARDRIVMVMTHTSPTADEPNPLVDDWGIRGRGDAQVFLGR